MCFKGKIMKQFYIFIDETGSFSYLDKPGNCFIGGWVCQCDKIPKNFDKRLRVLLQECVEWFNDKQYASKKLKYPEDMHFMPLHTPASRRNKYDQHITVTPDQIQPFFKAVFEAIKPSTALVFRSFGLPVIIPHEQAAYTEILRNTLLQLVSNKIFSTATSLKIIIASRRTAELLGYSGKKDPKKYEKYLADNLAREIQRTRSVKKKKIEISFASARKNPGLIIADFFCGAMKKNNYLNKVEINPDIYSFEAGYRLINLPTQEQLSYMCRHNPVAALEHGIQLYCGQSPTAIKTKEKLLDRLKNIYVTLTMDQKEVFLRSIGEYLENNLTQKATRYLFLNQGYEIIKALRYMIPDEASRMHRYELRIAAGLGLQNIRIASHQGRCDHSLIKKHIAFLGQWAHQIFSNRLEYIQHLVDTSLMAAQLEDFNQLHFAQVETTLTPVRKLYDDIFKATSATAGQVQYDENYAKLEGTYAQMCGFLYDLTGQEHYYQLAEEGLKNDIAACRPEDHVWEQGMGFLTALYWKRQDLAKTREQFCLEIGADADIKSNLYHLGHIPYDQEEKIFFLLHHLYLCALAQRNDEVIKGLEGMRDRVLNNRRISSYPMMLSAKWLAVLLMVGNKADKAIELLEKAAATPFKGDDFTYGFIRLPIKILLHQCKVKLGKSTEFNLQTNIDILDQQNPGTKAQLEKLGVNKFSGVPKDWDSYAVASFPPYYYA